MIEDANCEIKDLKKSFKVSVLPKYSIYIKRRIKMQIDLTFG
jgi:hypothetical protein